MARKTITELYTQATADFADNTTGAITPTKLRQFCLDFLDTVRPSYGAINLIGPLSTTMTTVDAGFVWSTVLAAQAPDYSASLASGTITRANGPASARFEFSMDFQAPNNSVTYFTMYVDNVATQWVTGGTSNGAAEWQSVSMSGVNYSANLSVSYQIRAKNTAGGNIILQNGILVVENVPVNVN